MLGKLFMLPVWIIQKGFGLIFLIVRAIIGLVGFIVRFLFSRTIGAIIGGLIGFFVGKNHVGVKWWKK
ncbi:MAG: hypothetical protein PHC61_13535 [Chitinivibrionales bacterium]|nr:hypothetical protein [Chitinivibrionales bacterium]